MRLALFSGQSWVQTFIDDFGKLMKLEDAQLNAVIKAALDIAKRGPYATTPAELRKELGLSQDDFRDFVDILAHVAPRVILGKNGPEVVDDLAAHGLPKDRIQSLFSLITNLSSEDKAELRYWGVDNELKEDTVTHLHESDSNVEFLTLMDGAFLVGVVPYSKFSLTAYNPQDEKDEKLTLFLNHREIGYLMKSLEILRKELEDATNSLKEDASKGLLTGGA